jgi:hypothetical protein
MQFHVSCTPTHEKILMPETMNIRHMDASGRAVILPHFGEFGWLILHHVRYVHAHPATSKIVCCPQGMACLYPSATGCFHDYAEPVPDDRRCNDGAWGDAPAIARTEDELRRRLAAAFPTYRIVQPVYDCHWHTSDLVKPRLTVPPMLPKADVVIGARRRDFTADKNWPHWQRLCRMLQSAGKTVGLAGAKETSFADIEANAKAWDHPGGATSGTVDLLAHCKLYIGTDSGVSHLAAMMDVPMIVWRIPRDGSPDQIGTMQRANRSKVRRLPDGLGDPDVVAQAAIEEIP